MLHQVEDKSTDTKTDKLLKFVHIKFMNMQPREETVQFYDMLRDSVDEQVDEAFKKTADQWDSIFTSMRQVTIFVGIAAFILGCVVGYFMNEFI